MLTPTPAADQPVFKLGKGPAQFDARNLQFESLLKSAPLVPDTYDFDAKHPGIPTPMFANNVHGDCVIAGRAHQTLRFELLEKGKLIAISDADVLTEYFKETGGPTHDNGLVVLNSLKAWQKLGWKVGTANYQISAYAQIDFKNQQQFKQAVFADVGIGLGILLPNSAKTQIYANKPWEVVTGPDSTPGSWGGHYVYVCGYTPFGPICVTWGRKQQMSWAWLAKYADEAYAIFDAHDNFNHSIIDISKLKLFIQKLPVLTDPVGPHV